METSEHKRMNINELELDVDNPRIRRFLEIYDGEPSAEQMAIALGFGEDKSTSSGTSFFSLKESIRSNGGIIHPIIVNKRRDGRNIVVEGNTRLAIYREFDHKGVPGNWKSIPTIMFNELPINEIDAIRLQAHLVGPREWDPYSKAKYLHHLSETEGMPFSQLVDYCGGRRADIERSISAYEDMEEFYRPIVVAEQDDFDVTKFSGFVELQKQKVKQSLIVANLTVGDFSGWQHRRLFNRQEHVRDLPRILNNSEAKSIFLKEGSREALKVFDAKNESSDLKDVSLEALCNELRPRLANMPFSEISSLRDNPENEKTEAILRLHDEIKNTVDFIVSDEG